MSRNPPEVAAKRGWFAEIAAALAESRVPAGIDHADLHPGNVFRGTNRIYDWGDSVIGHPFGSMLVALKDSEGKDNERAQDAYLECFTDLATRAELREDLRRARIAGNVIRALTWHRALHGETGTAFDGGPAVHLRQLLAKAPWACP